MTAAVVSHAPSPLVALRDVHRGSTIVVCGCGASLNDLPLPPGATTIGVNDVGRKFDPDYLVVVNPKSQFTGDRFQYIANSRAHYLITQYPHDDLPIQHPNIIRFRLGTYGGTDFSRDDVLHYTQNSPYVALCLAVHLGATRIGLIGVDFTDNHFFARSGRHPLAARLAQIDAEYAALGRACAAREIEIVNLSSVSRLNAFPKALLMEFLAGRQPSGTAATKNLNIVSYATTPVAGVPAILARCISERTRHTARCVWATRDYGNGVRFQGDVEWGNDPTTAEAVLAASDVIIVHNGKVDPRHRRLIDGKAVVTMAHNYMWNVDDTFVRQGLPGVVVGQYQATLAEFAGWHPVPNPLPVWEDDFAPVAKPARLTICYTPSGKHERYPANHRLHWHGKGYATTMHALERLSRRYPLDLEVIRERQVSHAESLAMKRRAHVVIDECVTGSYHRNSLEGLACGCVVVNGLGRLPNIAEVFRRLAGEGEGEGAPLPFVFSDLERLEGVLETLIEQGADELARIGAANRDWVARHWDFTRQWPKFWSPILDQAVDRAETRQRKRSAGTLSRGTAMPVRAESNPRSASVSVVIPHGGRERLPHLSTTLAHLASLTAVAEIIISELGLQPEAAEVARRWRVRHVFSRCDGPFERARALNIGSGLAMSEYVLWLDNDLLLADGFVERAITEATARQLDYLIPYCDVAYLSEADSQRIVQGSAGPGDCRPVKRLRSGRDVSGGAGLVRRAFLERFGGLSEDFRGWGGEDNAWCHKVAILGRTGVSSDGKQVAHHLHHPASGALAGTPAAANNPLYPRNVDLLRQMAALSTATAFLQRYPPPPHPSCPWSGERTFVFAASADDTSVEQAERWRNALMRFYHMGIDPVLTDPETIRRVHERQIPPVDALVIFGRELRNALLARTVDESGMAPCCIAIEASEALAPEEEERLRGMGVGVARSWPTTDESDGERSRASALAEALSVQIRREERSAASVEAATVRPTTSEPLPVWLYWEGPCPQWIEACRQTVFAHATNVRFLTPEDFDVLWETDRDIDLSPLVPAHRADFIRAHLLAKLGGLWIDSDCLVMKPLAPILEALHTFDFVAHRDRQGFFPNGFMAARKGSQVAHGLYARVCQMLRSGQSRGWISLGGEPLTEIIRSTTAPVWKLPYAQVQPICWRNPDLFFIKASDDEHRSRFNENALCYMLSNTEVQKFQRAHHRADLLDESTFFRFVLSRALMNRPSSNATVVAPPSRQVPIRPPFDLVLGALHDANAEQIVFSGPPASPWPGLIHEQFGTAVHVEHVASIADLDKTGGRQWDALLSGDLQDCLDHGLDAACAVAPYVVAVGRLPEKTLGHSLRYLRPFFNQQPLRHRIGDTHAAFVYSLRDPSHLDQVADNVDTFTRHIDLNRHYGNESLSGPGSDLVQTGVLRQRLPILFADLGVRSLIDAACGDLHWFSQIPYTLDMYIGVDLLKSIVDVNRQRWSAPYRAFFQHDIRRNPLPQADLILCRDCLVHFSICDIYRSLTSFARSGSTYLLTTTFPQRQRNEDVITGDWRPINLEQSPFSFPPPVRLINEGCTEANGQYRDKSLGLWRLADLVL